MAMAETSGNVHQPYVMAALGRCLKLGDLYDYRLDKVVAGNFIKGFKTWNYVKQQLSCKNVIWIY